MAIVFCEACNSGSCSCVSISQSIISAWGGPTLQEEKAKSYDYTLLDTTNHDESIPVGYYPERMIDATVRLLVDKWVKGYRDYRYHPGDPAAAVNDLINQYLKGIPWKTGIVSQKGFRVKLAEAIQDEYDYLASKNNLRK